MRRAASVVLFVSALALAPCALPGRARAQGTSTASPLSAYEVVSLREALASVNGVVEPLPEGKTLEEIVVVPLDVIEDRDPAPGFLNAFHTTTRRDRIRSEVLLPVGAPYEQHRVDEAVRVLRGYQQLSLVLATAMRGTTPDKVKLLVVTKDTWSLRAQFEMKLGSGGLDLLRLEPTERNIAGSLVSSLARFELFPENLNLGGAFYAPRLVPGTYFAAEGNLSFRRSDGSPEGTFGGVALFKPILSSQQRWAWQTGTRFRDVVVRRYVGGKLATFDAAGQARSGEALVPNAPGDDAIPDAFRERTLASSASVTRSWGGAHKLDLQVGAELNVRRAVGLDPSRYAPAVVQAYAQKRVPRSDDRVGPYVQLRAYESRFVRLHDVDLLGLAEDVRVGYDGFVRAYPVGVGASRNFIGVDALGQYVLPLGGGFARATAEAILEIQADAIPTEGFAANVTLVTPPLPFGRLVVDGVVLARPQNYLNVRAAIGGEGRLRGYRSAAFLGENLVAYNAELRTRPIEILACQLGGALFHDMGDAFDGRDIRVKSSVGFGLRAVFPQLDRRVWRVDIAFPLVRAGGEGPVGFYLSFEQAFPSQIVAAPGPMPTPGLLNPLGGALGQ